MSFYKSILQRNHTDGYTIAATDGNSTDNASSRNIKNLRIDSDAVSKAFLKENQCTHKRGAVLLWPANLQGYSHPNGNSASIRERDYVFTNQDAIELKSLFKAGC